MFELQFFLIGIIQGVTEFLPISSSGHLVLFAQLTNWEDQGLFTDCLLYTSPSPRDRQKSRMPSSA